MPAVNGGSERGRFLGIAAALAAALAVALYALAGFVLLPRIAEQELPRFARERLHCDARVGAVVFNPFTLALTARDFALECSGKPLFALRSAEADFEWRSLWSGTWLLSELRLVGPRLRIEISRGGELNLAALAGSAGSGAAPRFAVDRTAIEEGTVEFSDERVGYRDRFEHLSLDLRSLDSAPSRPGTYTLRAQTPRGARLQWKGEVSLAPFAAAGTLTLERVALPGLEAYLERYAALRAVAGDADVTLRYRARLDPGRSLRFVLEDSSASLRGVAFAVRGSTEPFLKLERAALEGVALDLRARRIEAKRLAIAGAALSLTRDSSGRFNLPAPAASRAPAPAPWDLSLDEIALDGIALRYRDFTAKKPLALAFDGLSGRLGVHARFGGERPQWRLAAGALSLAELRAGAVDFAPLVRLSDVTLTSASMDGASNALAFGALRIGEADATLAFAGGRLAALELVPAAPARTGRALATKLAAIEVADGSLAISDAASGLAIALDRLHAKLGALTIAPPSFDFDVSAELRSGGRLSASGRAALPAISAQVSLERVALPALQPLLARYANVRIVAGAASASGGLVVGERGGGLEFSGTASMDGVAIADSGGAPLLAWESLAARALTISLASRRLRIDELRWIAPKGRLAIAADRSTNLGHLLESRSTQAQPAQQRRFDALVRRVGIERGELDFSDDSVRPGFAVAIRGLDGAANDVSSDPGTRSNFSIEGQVGEYGFARISGALNPWALRDRTRFRVLLENLDMTAVTPYAMKFAGYRIASGRMSLDLAYRVDGGVLRGDNRVTLDRFTLGERVESPDAFKLPLELAVQLLKDDEGRIEVSIPVTGDLDDPHFDYGKLIRKAIGNLIADVLAAPFRALARLFGHEEKGAGAIAFEPGSSRLLPPEREKLARVAELLAKKPQLVLLVPARYDEDADAQALRRAALRRDVARRAGFSDSGGEAPINLEDPPTRAALIALFSERFSAAELDELKKQAQEQARASGAPGLSLFERLKRQLRGEPLIADPSGFYRALVQRLRESEPLAAGELADLARRRAQSIAEALRSAGVDPARIRVGTPAPIAGASGKQIALQLTLETR